MPRPRISSPSRRWRCAPHGAAPADDPRLEVAAFGRRFPNPVGLAAGFDKQCRGAGRAHRARLRLRRARRRRCRSRRPGTAPRVFRLPADEAVINRLGLNSDGLARGPARLAARRRRARHRRRQHRREQGFDRPRRRLRDAASRRSPRSSTSSPSTSPRRTRRACATFRAKPSSTICSARAVEARDRGGAAASARPACSSRSRRTLPSTRSTRSSRRRSGAGSTASIVSNTTIARPPQLRERELRQGKRRALGQAALRAFDGDAAPKPICGSGARCR